MATKIIGKDGLLPEIKSTDTMVFRDDGGGALGKPPPFITQGVEVTIIDDPQKVGTRPLIEILVREGDRCAKAWLDPAQADELAASIAWCAEDARTVSKSERFLATSPAAPSPD